MSGGTPVIFTSKTLAVLAAGLLLVFAGEARAAGAAYVVDTAEVTEAKACKVESWISSASNHDLIAAVAPTCGVDLFQATEVSIQLNRSRSEEGWGTEATPKVKTKLLPSAIGTWGLAIAAGGTFDLIARENTGAFAYLPATLRVSDNLRINVNAGWQWDRVIDRHYLLYGVGFDLRTSDNVWTLTGELFGLADVGNSSVTAKPGFQMGVRYRPIDRFNIDLIYGRNLTGENANWVTIATVVRFPPPAR